MHPLQWFSAQRFLAFRAPPTRLLSGSSAPRPPPRYYSPTDMTTYVESPWVSWLDRLAAEEPSHPFVSARDPPDAFLEMLGRKGAESEAAVLRALVQSSEIEVVDLSQARGSPEESPGNFDFVLPGAYVPSSGANSERSAFSQTWDGALRVRA